MLEVKKERRNLILTHKKSLVSSKYPVITDPSQTKPGMMLEGSICSIKGYGVFVNFYNNLQVKPTILTLKIWGHGYKNHAQIK